MQKKHCFDFHCLNCQMNLDVNSKCQKVQPDANKINQKIRFISNIHQNIYKRLFSSFTFNNVLKHTNRYSTLEKRNFLETDVYAIWPSVQFYVIRQLSVWGFIIRVNCRRTPAPGKKVLYRWSGRDLVELTEKLLNAVRVKYSQGLAQKKMYIFSFTVRVSTRYDISLSYDTPLLEISR